MQTKDAEQTGFHIFLDDVTVARLIEVAESCHASPRQIIAAIVRDVLEDDALAHMQEDHVTLQ